MLEAKFSRPKNWWIVYGSMVMLLITMAAAIWWGPSWVYRWGIAGAALSLAGVLLSVVFPNRFAEWPASVILLGSFFLMLIVGMISERLLLMPLNDASLKIPLLGKKLSSPHALFNVAGLEDWTYEKKSTPLEDGIIFRPGSKSSYMGVSEAYVYVRPVEKGFKNPEKFLTRVAANLNHLERAAKKDTVFNLRTEPATLLSGDQGVWSVFDLKKLWVPLRQVTLMGIKNKRYLCTVSAMGLASHSTLYKVFCLGIFQTIRIDPDVHPS